MNCKRELFFLEYQRGYSQPSLFSLVAKTNRILEPSKSIYIPVFIDIGIDRLWSYHPLYLWCSVRCKMERVCKMISE